MADWNYTVFVNLILGKWKDFPKELGLHTYYVQLMPVAQELLVKVWSPK